MSDFNNINNILSGKDKFKLATINAKLSKDGKPPITMKELQMRERGPAEPPVSNPSEDKFLMPQNVTKDEFKNLRDEYLKEQAESNIIYPTKDLGKYNFEDRFTKTGLDSPERKALERKNTLNLKKFNEAQDAGAKFDKSGNNPKYEAEMPDNVLQHPGDENSELSFKNSADRKLRQSNDAINRNYYSDRLGTGTLSPEDDTAIQDINNKFLPKAEENPRWNIQKKPENVIDLKDKIRADKMAYHEKVINDASRNVSQNKYARLKDAAKADALAAEAAKNNKLLPRLDRGMEAWNQGLDETASGVRNLVKESGGFPMLGNVLKVGGPVLAGADLYAKHRDNELADTIPHSLETGADAAFIASPALGALGATGAATGAGLVGMGLGTAALGVEGGLSKGKFQSETGIDPDTGMDIPSKEELENEKRKQELKKILNQ